LIFKPPCSGQGRQPWYAAALYPQSPRKTNSALCETPLRFTLKQPTPTTSRRLKESTIPHHQANMAPQPAPPLITPLHQICALYNGYIFPLLPEPVQSLSESITPFLTTISTAAMSGDMVSLAAFLLSVYLVLKIADYIRRSVIGWVLFFVKIALFILAVQVVFYVNRNGLQQALGDAEWLLGFLWGLVEDKVAAAAAAGDNRTRGFGSNNNNNAFGGLGYGKQQVPMAQGRTKARSGGSWR
jgi:hypothetical protein